MSIATPAFIMCVSVCVTRIREIFENQFSQQPLVGSYSNLKLKLIGPNQRIKSCQMKMTFNGRRPKMEDDLKMSKVDISATTCQIVLKLQTL